MITLMVVHRGMQSCDVDASEIERSEQILYFYPDFTALREQLNIVARADCMIGLSGKFALRYVALENEHWTFFWVDEETYIASILPSDMAIDCLVPSDYVESLRQLYLTYSMFHGDITQSIADDEYGSGDGWSLVKSIQQTLIDIRELRNTLRDLSESKTSASIVRRELHLSQVMVDKGIELQGMRRHPSYRVPHVRATLARFFNWYIDVAYEDLAHPDMFAVLNGLHLYHRRDDEVIGLVLDLRQTIQCTCDNNRIRFLVIVDGHLLWSDLSADTTLTLYNLARLQERSPSHGPYLSGEVWRRLYDDEKTESPAWPPKGRKRSLSHKGTLLLVNHASLADLFGGPAFLAEGRLEFESCLVDAMARLRDKLRATESTLRRSPHTSTTANDDGFHATRSPLKDAISRVWSSFTENSILSSSPPFSRLLAPHNTNISSLSNSHLSDEVTCLRFDPANNSTQMQAAWSKQQYMRDDSGYPVSVSHFIIVLLTGHRAGASSAVRPHQLLPRQTLSALAKFWTYLTEAQASDRCCETEVTMQIPMLPISSRKINTSSSWSMLWIYGWKRAAVSVMAAGPTEGCAEDHSFSSSSLSTGDRSKYIVALFPAPNRHASFAASEAHAILKRSIPVMWFS